MGTACHISATKLDVARNYIDKTTLPWDLRAKFHLVTDRCYNGGKLPGCFAKNETELPVKLISYNRTRLVSLADMFAVLLAASLPWSTSATGIIAFLWLLAFIPTCDFSTLRRIVSSPSGGLPLLLVALGALGMLWADVA